MNVIKLGSGGVKISLTITEARQFASSGAARANIGEAVRALIADESGKATPVQIMVMNGALKALDICREKCPGIGGDVDAMNLRFLIEKGEYAESGIQQATRTLAYLAHSLGIDMETEIAALREIAP